MLGIIHYAWRIKSNVPIAYDRSIWRMYERRRAYVRKVFGQLKNFDKVFLQLIQIRWCLIQQPLKRGQLKYFLNCVQDYFSSLRLRRLFSATSGFAPIKNPGLFTRSSRYHVSKFCLLQTFVCKLNGTLRGGIKVNPACFFRQITCTPQKFRSRSSIWYQFRRQLMTGISIFCNMIKTKGYYRIF